ncbi:MAG: transcriptional repressor [Bacteroidales bacterium]|nr:transcriptional repressor [Bacteroidales bacterium]
MTQAIHTPDLNDFKKALKNHGLKATGQRLAIHAAMMELGHASADQVREHILAHGGAVTVASVYNTLTQFALLGIYKHRLSANNKMYFDVNTVRHIHLYDVYNNQYKDVFDDELLATVESALKRRRFRGFKVDGIDIQILCHPSHRKTPLSF